MRTLTRIRASLAAARRGTVESVAVFVRDTGQGLLEVSHSSLALLGLVLVAVLLFIAGQQEFRHVLEVEALSSLN